MAAMAEAVGMEKSSAENYTRLLEAVFVVQRLPAWGTAPGPRVTRQPKGHVDLVLERDAGAVFTFEIKAGTRVDRAHSGSVRS
ncbi:hypothetical protein [Actinoplanes sp. NPDC049802]|uniref:hypothetical protein n=1 Tax=Actinoplanes sp. NPDC049802 TaxID=3154742 RepID=UPI00340534F9